MHIKLCKWNEKKKKFKVDGYTHQKLKVKTR